MLVMQAKMFDIYNSTDVSQIKILSIDLCVRLYKLRTKLNIK